MQTCPHCRATIDQRNVFAGVIHCPACGKSLEAPQSESIVSAEMATTLAPAASAMPVSPGKPPVVAAAGINPYSDLAANPYHMPFMPAWQPDRARALSKVKGPGILMQAYGILICLAGIGCMAMPFVVPEMNEDDKIALWFIFGLGTLGLPVGVLTFWAGTRMKSLRSYGLAMTAVILTFVIAFLACLPAVIIGIWPLVALLDADVKASFDKPVA